MEKFPSMSAPKNNNESISKTINESPEKLSNWDKLLQSGKILALSTILSLSAIESTAAQEKDVIRTKETLDLIKSNKEDIETLSIFLKERENERTERSNKKYNTQEGPNNILRMNVDANKEGVNHDIKIEQEPAERLTINTADGSVLIEVDGPIYEKKGDRHAGTSDEYATQKEFNGYGRFSMLDRDGDGEIDRVIEDYDNDLSKKNEVIYKDASGANVNPLFANKKGVTAHRIKGEYAFTVNEERDKQSKKWLTTDIAKIADFTNRGHKSSIMNNRDAGVPDEYKKPQDVVIYEIKKNGTVEVVFLESGTSKLETGLKAKKTIEYVNNFYGKKLAKYNKIKKSWLSHN